MSTLRFNTWQNTGGTEVANSTLGTGKILQVVSTTKTDTFSASVAVGAAADITGLSVSITPSSTNSDILIFATVHGGVSVRYERFAFQLVRDSTAIGIGDSAGSRTPVTSASLPPFSDNNGFSNVSAHLLDSPATTSATTYKIQAVNATINATTQTMYVNRSPANSDFNYIALPVSSLTVMEVSA